MMANYNQMSTKKLNALLETANDEEKVLINEVLAKRNSMSNASMADVEPMIPGMKPDASEQQESAEKKSGRKAGPQLTTEEAEALANELRTTSVHHRCEVVPFGTIEWVSGVISGIIVEKRTNKVLYAVQTDDGRRVVKVYGSQLIKILDEVVEPAKKERKTRTPKLDENGNPIESETKSAFVPFTEEEWEQEISKVIDNVGKKISFPEAGKMGVIAEDAPTITGRIVSLVPAKRTNTVLYRVLVDAAEGEEAKYAHKACTKSELVIEETIDEEGQKIQDAFKKRRYAEKVEKVEMSLDEKIEVLKASIAKAEENVAKAQKVLEDRKAKLEKLMMPQSDNNEAGNEPTNKVSANEEGEDLM